MATLDIDEETKDTSQFRVVSHPPKFEVDILCDNIKDNANLSKLKNINCGKLSKKEKNKIEESIYEMMEKFKKNPLELDNSMHKDLNSLIEINGIIA